MDGEKYKHLFDAKPEPRILLEDADFLAVAKPPGMETVSRDGQPDLAGWLREARSEPGLAPAHRLDRDTSGAQLFARNAAAERELAGLFRRRLVDKIYLGICLGVPRNREGTINRNLSEWAGGRRPVRVVRKGGLEASTRYRVVAESAELPGGFRAGLLAFWPHQGRTHQIRVHAAAFGYPLLGDDQYGDRPANRLARAALGIVRQALHSRRLAFEWRGAGVAVDCPPWDDLRLAVDTAFGIADGAITNALR